MMSLDKSSYKHYIAQILEGFFCEMFCVYVYTCSFEKKGITYFVYNEFDVCIRLSSKLLKFRFQKL